MNIAVILVGSIEKRFNSQTLSQFIKIGNKTIIEYSIEAFENSVFYLLAYFIKEQYNYE